MTLLKDESSSILPSFFLKGIEGRLVNLGRLFSDFHLFPPLPSHRTKNPTNISARRAPNMKPIPRIDFPLKTYEKLQGFLLAVAFTYQTQTRRLYCTMSNVFALSIYLSDLLNKKWLQ